MNYTRAPTPDREDNLMRRTLLVLPPLSTRGVVLFGAMILALALIALAVGTSAKQADAATRLVTKTFTN